MFAMVKTLVTGASARAEDNLRDHFAVDLLDQKIRESEAALGAAKETLAALIIRERNERRALETVKARIADLEARTRQALEADKDALAQEAASAIAELENEAVLREATVAKLSDRVGRMRLSVEKTHRRIVDLKQGMIQARAIDAEAKAQKKMNRAIGANTSMREAQQLLDRILERDDPLEETGVLDEIDAGLNHTDIRDRMAAQGLGEKTKSTADDVLARLKAGNAG